MCLHIHTCVSALPSAAPPRVQRLLRRQRRQDPHFIADLPPQRLKMSPLTSQFILRNKAIKLQKHYLQRNDVLLTQRPFRSCIRRQSPRSCCHHTRASRSQCARYSLGFTCSARHGAALLGFGAAVPRSSEISLRDPKRMPRQLHKLHVKTMGGGRCRGAGV